jgi:N-methylhydantoinase A
MDPATLKAAFASLAETGREYLSSEGITPEAISYERSVDFRYHGQEYVMTIPLPSGTIDMAAVRASFDVAYERQYGHSSPEGRVEMANIRLAALGRRPRPVNAPPASVAARPPRERAVHFAGAPQKTVIPDRNGMTEGKVVSGPAIIEEGTATTLLPPGWQARLIVGGHMSQTRTGAAI